MISDDRIRSLAAHRGSPVVTSCYLDVDGRRHPRHVDYEQPLDHLMRQARERAGELEPAAIQSVEADLHRISTWVKGGFDRSRVRGLAFFCCSAEKFFEVVESPRPVRNEIVLNHTPHVRQLESLAQEYDRFAVVLVDGQRARLFRFEQGSCPSAPSCSTPFPAATTRGAARRPTSSATLTNCGWPSRDGAARCAGRPWSW